MGLIGKVTIREKKEGKRYPVQTGFLIKTLKKDNAGTANESNTIHLRLQTKLIEYCFPRAFKEAKDSNDKGIQEAFLSDHIKKCHSLPIKLLSSFDFKRGRTCWPKDARASNCFCHMIKDVHNDTSIALRRTADEIEEVACDPSSCEFAKGETKKARKCTPFSVLPLQLDLPEIGISSLSYFKFTTRSINSLISLENSIKRLYAMAGHNLIGIPLIMRINEMTIRGNDDKIRIIKYVTLDLNEREETVLDIVKKNSERQMVIAQANMSFTPFHTQFSMGKKVSSAEETTNDLEADSDDMENSDIEEI